MRYFIELSYFGKPYHGWQKQPNATTVQQCIEEALSTIVRLPLSIMGAGRTDTGVHANQMFAHVDIVNHEEVFKSANIKSLKALKHKLNRFLPPSISIIDVFEVPEEAHARFDAESRTYRYKIAKHKNPFTTAYTHLSKYDLDLVVMQKATAILLDYTDFKCFSKSNTEVNNYLCHIAEARWEETEDEYHFVITANRFLRNMVRAIVGTLLEIGRKKQPVSWMHEVITNKKRSLAGSSAPAQGLYLERVTYPEHIIKNNGRQ